MLIDKQENNEFFSIIDILRMSNELTSGSKVIKFQNKDKRKLLRVNNFKLLFSAQ